MATQLQLARFALLALLLGVPASPVASAEPGDAVDFQRDVRPILSDNCFQCHGPDEAAREVGLRLDTRDGAFGSRPPIGRSTRPRPPAIVPGDVAGSLLIERILHSDERRRMPPAVSKKSLSDQQVDILKRWIEQGAAWDQHWSFKPIAAESPPAVASSEWARQPLDRFILARLEQEGLEPAAEADRRTLARRVALDLTGLPPDPGTLATFLADDRPGAYERLVDRLLDSRHWGEHRARYWLDAARYGDTHGYHIDNYREMWAYRDWVIDAFNRNQPFDQFAIEQIAGDLLPDPTLDQLIATGFQRNNITTNEGGVVPEEYEAIYAKDRAETIGDVFLGLTVGCATCHDHKFDPIAQREFYALTAFFRNTTQYVMDGNIADPPPTLVVPRPEDRQAWRALRDEARDLEAQLRARETEVEAAFSRWLDQESYRDLDGPLGSEAELLTLLLDGDDGPSVVLDGERAEVEILPGAELAPGPQGHRALMFGEDSWAELPSLPLDTGDPFSIAMWIYMPQAEAGFTVASQYDPEDGNRGWSITIGARQLFFRISGDRPAPDQGATSARVGPINTKRLIEGEWTHIVVTHDGSGERAGLDVFRNGEPIEKEGSEYFARISGSMLTDRPLLLGRGELSGDDGARHFGGGGIAGFRVFDRALSAEEARVVSEWRVLERAAATPASDLDGEQLLALRRHYLTAVDDDYRARLARKRELSREWRELRRNGTVTHVMQEVPGSEAAAHVLFRGMYDQPRERVLAGTPAILPPLPASLPRNRLGLARWLVDASNPLTARVTVNRFWQQLFGTGLVATSQDFGAQGEPPSHPQLLDYLAETFRQSGWDVKGLFRSMVLSSTYRQAAATTVDKLERDPQNRLLSRGPRFRMDAEMVRDYALAASGLLVRKIGGPSVRPYQPEGVWSTVAMPVSNTARYERDSGDKLYRRSLYTFWKRAAPPPSMTIFNAPTREHSKVRRERTNTPLQALVTMNDTQFVEAHRFLAQRAMREAGDDFDRRLDYITNRLLARRFEDRERAVARRTYERFVDLYGANEEEAVRLLDVGDSPYDAALPAAESAAWTMLSNQLMNLDEVLNK